MSEDQIQAAKLNHAKAEGYRNALYELFSVMTTKKVSEYHLGGMIKERLGVAEKVVADAKKALDEQESQPQ